MNKGCWHAILHEPKGQVSCNFRDLLVGTAQHPAMLFFLDNFESVSPNAATPGNGQNAGRLQQIINSGGQLPPLAREQLKQQYGVNDAQLDQRLMQMKANPQQAKQLHQFASVIFIYAPFLPLLCLLRIGFHLHETLV